MRRIHKEQGSVLVMVLILMSVLLILGIAQIKLVSLAYQKGKAQLYSLKAQYAAEAGVERAVSEYLLNTVKQQWAALPASTVWKDEAFAGGTYTVKVEGINATTANVYSTGTWKNAYKQLEVTYVANWNIDPPLIRRILWREL